MTGRRVAAGVLVAAALVLAVVTARSCTDAPEPSPTAPESPAPPAEPSPEAAGSRARRPGAAPPAAPAPQEDAPAAPPVADEDAAPSSVEVLVLDATGVPAAGARVGFGMPNVVEISERATVTDAAGHATVAGGASLARLLALRGDEVAIGPTRMQWPAHETLRLVPGVVVRGRVVGPGGSPVAGAHVSVGTTVLESVRQIASATTDAEGRFRATPLAPDWIDPPPQEPGEGGVTVRVYVESLGSCRVHFDAEAVRSRELTVRVERQRRLTGRCVSEDGDAIERAEIRVDGESSWAQSTANGRFELLFSRRDALPLTVFAEGFVAQRFVVPATFPRADGDPVPADAAQEDLGDLVLRRGGSVSGRAVDEAGEPCGSATVRLLAVDGTTVGETKTDDEGAFALAGVGDGVHSLDADGFDLSDPPLFGHAGPVRAGDAGVGIVLSPGRAVRVHLVAAEDGKPLAVRVFTLIVRPARSLENWTESITVGPSRDTICRAVAHAGVWDVAVSVPGRLPGTVRGVVVRDDAITDVDVVLREP